MPPSAKLAALSAQRTNGFSGTNTEHSPGVASVLTEGDEPPAAPLRRRVESWAAAIGRLRAWATPLMMAASSASVNGFDGHPPVPGGGDDVDAGRGPPEAPAPGGGPPVEHPARTIAPTTAASDCRSHCGFSAVAPMRQVWARPGRPRLCLSAPLSLDSGRKRRNCNNPVAFIATRWDLRSPGIPAPRLSWFRVNTAKSFGCNLLTVLHVTIYVETTKLQ